MSPDAEITSAEREKRVPVKIDVISWNAGGNVFANPEAVQGIHTLAAMGPDAIFLQEVGMRPVVPGGKSTYESLVETMGDDWELALSGYQERLTSEDDETGFPKKVKDEGGIVTMVRKVPGCKVERFEAHSLSPYAGPDFLEKLKAIAGNDDRMAQFAVIKKGDTLNLFVNAHLDWQGGPRQRSAQLRTIRHWVGKIIEETQNTGQQIHGVVIMGDMNIPSTGEAMAAHRSLNVHNPDQYLSYDEVIPDEPTIFQLGGKIGLKPDMAMISTGVKKKMEVIPNNFGSDHRPIKLSTEN